MHTINIPYQDQGVDLEAFVAYPTVKKRPVVILCHAWKGKDDFICEKAKAIAEWGYVGFALDMYGKGVLGKSKEENTALKKPFMENRQLLLNRVIEGFNLACIRNAVFLYMTRSSCIRFHAERRGILSTSSKCP